MLKHIFSRANEFRPAPPSMTGVASVRGAKLNLREMGEVSLLLEWIIALQLPG